jgi:hypothetical protein
MPEPVQAAFDAFPAPVRERLLEVRAAVLDIAAETPGVGPLTETLKWGEPAYLTEVSRSGSTIRLGWPKAQPDRTAIYFNCNTSLVATFREIFGDRLEFAGNRAVLLPLAQTVPGEAIALCLSLALTYKKPHLRAAGQLTRDFVPIMFEPCPES